MEHIVLKNIGERDNFRLPRKTVTNDLVLGHKLKPRTVWAPFSASLTRNI